MDYWEFMSELEAAAKLPRITHETYTELAEKAEANGHLLIAKDLRDEAERLKRLDQPRE